MPPDQKQRLKALLSEGSSLSARQTLYALGRRYIIDILDPAPLCQGRFSRFVRRVHRCPSFSTEPVDYLKFLVARLRAEHYDVLIPTHEQVYLLARFGGSLARHVGVALPEFAVLDRMQNKADFSRLLDELDLPQPRAVVIRTRDELMRTQDYPCYVKLSYSTAGSGVRKVNNADELRAVANEFAALGLLDGHAETVIQQPAVGVQSTVQAVFQHGRLVAAHCFEALAIGVGGMSMARVSAWHPSVIEHIRRIGEHLNWHGAMFVDYFYDAATGRPEYIEANPRIGETVNALLSGRNLVEYLVQVSVARGEVPAVEGPPRIGVRTHSGFMILMAKALEGQSRGQIFSELRELRAGRGFYAGSEDELTRRRDDRLSWIPAAAIRLQLLANPAASKRIVNKTVENYSLPESAVTTIRQLPDDTLDRLFAEAVGS